MKKYVVFVQLDLAGDKFGEYSGVEHEDWVDAKHEMDEALEHDDIYHAWIREEERENGKTYCDLKDLIRRYKE